MIKSLLESASSGHVGNCASKVAAFLSPVGSDLTITIRDYI